MSLELDPPPPPRGCGLLVLMVVLSWAAIASLLAGVRQAMDGAPRG